MFILHSKNYTTAGQYTDYCTSDYVPLIITVYDCVTAYLWYKANGCFIL